MTRKKPPRRRRARVSSERNIRPEERVYCNRKLKMSRVRALGFDMDHTLAIYRREIEDLAFRFTIEKMIDQGYPEDLRELAYDRDLAIRGLVVDKEHGNLIKIDRYKYVTSAFHGTRPLTYDERKAAYSNRRLDLADPSFHNLDTLFTIPEAVLYAKMIDIGDAAEGPRPRWDYRQLFDDIRQAIDTAHRDGSLKAEVMSDLATYFVPDPELAPTLERFRAAGKKVFLLTNSELSYTEAVMSFILPPDETAASWKEHFDLVAVSARKPLFFAEGTPLELVETGDRYRVMQGGNVERLEAMLEVRGEGVLYFGDHTYGDIMKSKKFSLWRTAMIVEELAEEIPVTRGLRRQTSRLDRLYTQKGVLQDDLVRQQESLDALRAQKLAGKAEAEDIQAVDRRIAEVERRLRRLDKKLTTNLTRIKELEARITRAYNPYWGPLFRAGTEMSRVADQIEDFACIYTARVSNFRHYPVNKYFMSPRDRMVHDL